MKGARAASSMVSALNFVKACQGGALPRQSKGLPSQNGRGDGCRTYPKPSSLAGISGILCNSGTACWTRSACTTPKMQTSGVMETAPAGRLQPWLQPVSGWEGGAQFCENSDSRKL